MLSNIKKFYRYIILAIGLFFVLIPLTNRENDILYIISPWIFLGCFLYFTRTIKKKREWLLFGFAYLVSYELRYAGFLGGTEILTDIISLLLILVLVAATLIPFFVDFLYFKCGHGPAAILAFPIIRIIVERLLAGKQFNLSTTQFGNKLLIQSAACLGDVFVSFIVTLIPSVIVYMIIKREKKMQISGLIILIAFGLIMILGGIRYYASPKADNAIKMAYSSGPQKTYYEIPSEKNPEYEENLAYLQRTVKEASENGAKLIAYDEEAFLLNKTDAAKLTEEAKKLAKEYDIFILLCLDTESESRLYINKALFINNEGVQLSDYAKSNLIPVIETEEYIEGDGVIPSNYVTIAGQERVISYTVCYDATFSEYLLTMDENTDTFINPSWDWAEIIDLNYRLQGISALESGVVLFKPTVDGWSIVSDPYGRVTYKESTLAMDYNSLYYADVPAAKTKTLYRSIYKYVQVIWIILYVLIIIDTVRLIVIVIIRKKRDRNH